MEELKIDHFAMCTNSEAESDKFFIELLGCKKTRAFTVSTELIEKFFSVSEQKDIVRYEKSGVSFEIFVMNDDSKARDIFTHSCILVPDRDEFVSKANTMNYKTIQVPRKNSDSYYLFIKDNYGNLFEVKDMIAMTKEKDYSKIIELEKIHHSKLFPKKDFVVVKGKGALLYDGEGNEYIDCVAGHAVLNIGHSHPKYIETVKSQLENLVMVPPGYPVEERAKLLEKLAMITAKPLTQTFLSNSGTESVEAAIKLALVANRDKKTPEIIAFKRDFHGRTLGSLALTFNMTYRKPFMSWLSPNVKYASFGNIDSVKEQINDNTVAIITELIQGEGGVHPSPDEFPKALREICNEKNLILIDDEVQTGFGRTGKMFAYEHYDIVPDVVCMAKSIANGLPMGATIASEELYNNFKIGEHNTTFGGNPLVCAAANATIEIIQEEKLVENAANQGKKFLNSFTRLAEEHNHIRGVRGKGLMIGVDFKKPVKSRIQKAVQMGVLLLNAGLTVVRLLPPLVIDDNQVEKVIDIAKEISK